MDKVQTFGHTGRSNSGEPSDIHKTTEWRGVIHSNEASAADDKYSSAFLPRSVNLSVNFPEILFSKADDRFLHVTHGLGDPHHVFEVNPEEDGAIWHIWGPKTQPVPCKGGGASVEVRVAKFLNVEAQKVTIVPHHCLTKMRVFWVGKRRWKQSRKRYKQLTNKRRDEQSRRQRRF
ncbi:unnamed protein product [Phytophthora fragariaefolia]|uniref:Unnamed protein product n=1 Tax=Phytophthora fragariaefolia TaxID=1490495 RepID=A0A9W6X7A6_9STRA|nr:unnamed protein product [Phytophthora fragariaefolia]